MVFHQGWLLCGFMMQIHRKFNLNEVHSFIVPADEIQTRVFSWTADEIQSRGFSWTHFLCCHIHVKNRILLIFSHIPSSNINNLDIHHKSKLQPSTSSCSFVMLLLLPASLNKKYCWQSAILPYYLAATKVGVIKLASLPPVTDCSLIVCLPTSLSSKAEFVQMDPDLLPSWSFRF